MPIGSSAVKKIKRPALQKITSIPAPIGGLNARDSLAAMPPTDAFGLINWIPQQYGLLGRKGYSEWATGLGAQCQSVMNWFGPGTTIPTTASFQIAPSLLPGKVFAATDSKIFDISASGAVGASVVTLSGATQAGTFSTVNFSNAGNGWLLGCSETDGYYTFDGATWVKVTLGGGGTQVSVVDPTTFCAVAIWKRRAWFVVKGTSKVCYLPVDSVYGAASPLDVGPLLKHGGSVAWIANWTIDAGEGIDDFLVIASENGDIVVYKGTDPASATTFTLQGVWYAGEVPKGRKGFTTFGGDLLIISNLGIIPMSYITRGGANVLSAGTGNYTDKIQQLFSQDISTTFNFFGWEMLQCPRENLMIVTVPNTQIGVFTQYALNLSNNQWTLFADMPMTCVRSVANWPLFGTADGRVCIAFLNFTDNNLLSGTIGQPIRGLIQPAFSYFQEQGKISQNKHFLMVRPNFLSTKKPGYVLQMNTEFSNAIPGGTPLVSTSTGALWDVAKWDQALWGGGTLTYKEWQSVENFGFAGQASLVTLNDVEQLLISFDYMYELGGPM